MSSYQNDKIFDGRRSNHGLPFVHIDNIHSLHDHAHPNNQRKKMAQMKFTLFIFQCFGWASILGGIVSNLDSIKAGILFVLGVLAAFLTIWSKWLDLKKKGEKILSTKRKKEESRFIDIRKTNLNHTF